MPKELPPLSVLRQLLCYEPDTGLLFWLPRDQSFFKSARDWKIWNTRYAGQEAFTARQTGYAYGRVLGAGFMAHRVAWAIFHGHDPVGEIDHINGVREDNRIINLRDVPKSENHKNRKMQCNNTSGFNGVSWDSRERKWAAYITVGGRQVSLKTHNCIGAAIKARNEASRRLGFTDRHGKALDAYGTQRGVMWSEPMPHYSA